MDAACIDFLNSEFRDFRGRWVRDDLQEPGWLTTFLQRWQLEVAEQADAETINTLKALRALMRRIVETLPQGAPTEEDLAALNGFMAHAASVPHLCWDREPYQIELIPVQRDWSWVMGEIAFSLADLLAHSDTRRLKICENPNCRGVFYDESKSRTKRYCTSDKCGNLLKLRRFRARHKV